MNNTVNLDVLVVYSAGAALSASIADSESKSPFRMDSKEANYNLPYAFFLEACETHGLNAGFTTSSDIIGPGTCKSYWTISAGNWVKVLAEAKADHIFDKVSPTSLVRATERQLLLSHPGIIPFNDIDLFATFFDKQLTYQKLAKYTIPTVSVLSHSIEDVKAALKDLQTLVTNHLHPEDFTSEIVLKDRFGASGVNVYKICDSFAEKIRQTMMEHQDVQFIIQPFLSFNAGYAYKDNKTSTDIRLIFHHDELLQCYIRMAQGDAFLCNEHQGGQLEYVTTNDIPELIQAMSKKIVAEMNKPDSMYALDFVMSNTGRAYLLEGNIGPGVDWDVTKKFNEEMSKELITSIVEEFVTRINALKRS